MKSSLLFIATLLVVLFAVTANCKLDDLLNAYARIEKLKRDLRNRHSLADSQLPSYCSVALYNACPANSLCTCTRVNECGVCTSNTCGCGSSLIGALEDVESDKFFKKLGKLFKKALPYLKAGVKEYVNNNLADTQAWTPGQIAANFARGQIGRCYSQAQRYGNPCFDCSGLVLKSWAAAGRSVPTYTGAYPGGLREVSVNAMQEGDIVFRPGHVGIYVGGGQIVSAENSKNGVRMRDVNTYKKWFGITKVFRP
ncbi:hypothetical protein ABK040_002371 [Willaertia magna]